MPLNNSPTHLDAERLAALDLDPPTLDELAHLAACALCRAEREAFASLVAQAAALGAHDTSDAPRLVPWDRLSSALREEGLLTSTVDITPLRTSAVSPLIVRTLDGVGVDVRETPVSNPAVAATLAERGTHDDALTPMRGTPMRGAPTWSRRAVGARALRIAAALLAMAGSAVVGRATAGNDGALSFSGTANGAGPSGGTPIVATANGSANADGFGSVDEATSALARAQQEYERAALWLAGNDTTTRSSEVYRARLAALDQMMAASRAALRDAPQDPVLNHYFLAASTAREATLQQLGGALPVDKTIESY